MENPTGFVYLDDLSSSKVDSYKSLCPLLTQVINIFISLVYFY